MSVTSIPTNNVHNNSFTDVLAIMLWPSCTLHVHGVYSDEGHGIVVETSVKELL